MIEKNYCVYMHINKINNKIYIGQTCQNPEKRWKNGNGYKTGTHFRNAIDKYGWDNFEHIIWAENLTEEMANKAEELLIVLWDARNPSKGYNICYGGDNHKLSEETKRKIGTTKIGNKNMLGKHHTDEAKKKMSEAKKGKKLHSQTEETKQKMSQSHKGIKNTWQNKMIVQLTKDNNIVQIFDSGCEAERQTGIKNANIFRAIKTGICAGGYHWKYYEEEVA